MLTSLAAALVGVLLFLLGLYSFADPSLCAKGCGNLLEPVFQLAYAAFGTWGVRALLLGLSLLAFSVVVRSAKEGD